MGRYNFSDPPITYFLIELAEGIFRTSLFSTHSVDQLINSIIYLRVQSLTPFKYIIMSEEIAIRDRKDTHAKKEKRDKKKRTSEEEDGDDETLVKKSKSSKRRRLDDDAEEEPKEHKKEKKEKKKKEKKESHRKSVTFTEDTKNEEEDSSSAEDISAEPAQTAEKQKDEPLPEEESSEARKKRKREKRAQRHQNQTGDGGDGQKAPPTVPYDSDDKSVLSYLSQYHTDRSAWKFQKNRESQLLKKALSLEDVPAEYNKALFAYLRGLKSEGARQRLRKNAQDAIKLDEGDAAANAEEGEEATTTTPNDNDEDKKDSALPPPLPESSKEAYDDAIDRFKGNLNAGVKDFDDGVSFQDADADIQQRFEKRRRAELVLWTVRGKISKPSTTTSTSTSAPEIETTKDDKVAAVDKGNKNKKAPSRKKRKNRTMVVEISSSSESSDSE